MGLGAKGGGGALKNKGLFVWALLRLFLLLLLLPLSLLLPLLLLLLVVVLLLLLLLLLLLDFMLLNLLLSVLKLVLLVSQIILLVPLLFTVARFQVLAPVSALNILHCVLPAGALLKLVVRSLFFMPRSMPIPDR